MLIPGRISLYLSFEKRGLADEKVPVTVCYSAFSISCSSFFEKIFPQEKSPRRCYCPANISKIKKRRVYLRQVSCRRLQSRGNRKNRKCVVSFPENSSINTIAKALHLKIRSRISNRSEGDLLPRRIMILAFKGLQCTCLIFQGAVLRSIATHSEFSKRKIISNL